MGTEMSVIISTIAGIVILFALIKTIEPAMLTKKHEKLRAAAEQGDFPALHHLALEYYDEKYKMHFTKFPNLAVDVFKATEKLIETGENKCSDYELCDEDYYLLGLMYEEGFGTQKDRTKAVEYFNKALEFIKNLSDEDAILFENSAERIKQKLQQYSQQ